MAETSSPVSLKEIAGLFFKLGCIRFGGPAAHIAMMEREVVQKKQWIAREHFLDLIGATNLIPGPNSTEMTMHCGHEKAGVKGLIIAGVCFIFPAVLITGLLAWAYERYGKLPEVQPFIYGIKPAIISIIISAMIGLSRSALKSKELGILALLVFIACAAGVHEMLALFWAGFAGMAVSMYRQRIVSKNIFLPLAGLVNNDYVFSSSFTAIFWTFLKIGSILYGSGYVLFAFLDAELVNNGLLSRQQLIDAVAVGQITPGPVFSAATFVGWQLGGWSGAIAATIGIFLPSFIFVGLLNPLIPKLRQSKIMSAFLDAINAASIAVILNVCVDMGKETLTDWKTITIALIGLVIMLLFKRLNTAAVVAGGAALGYVLGKF